jgi:aspartate kinase
MICAEQRWAVPTLLTFKFVSSRTAVVAVIVQKFGGTSVADTDKIRAAAKRALDAQAQGNQVVMVVSAMGKSTDQLVNLAGELTETPPARDMDMLLSTGEQVSVALMSMAIHEMGGKAVSMTGSQLGIATDGNHTKAKILSISTERIRAKLDDGHIVVACGFQGVNSAGEITTLGRGGSDTSAVALAAALRPSQCLIHTDVDGVYTTDPRLESRASKFSEVSFEEMLELAGMGAGVMHSRSIEIGKRFGIPIYVRSSFDEKPGSWIYTDEQTPRRAVAGAALLRNECRVTVFKVPDRPGAARTIFSKIARKNVAVDMIVQNVADDGTTDISFTVQKGDFPDTIAAAKAASNEIGAGGIDFENDVAKISVVGLGMAETPGVAAKMFLTLADAGINILMITTSEIKVSVLVSQNDAADALGVVHTAFGLNELSDDGAEERLARYKTGDDAPEEPTTQLDMATSSDDGGRHLEQVTMESISVHSGQSLIKIGAVPDEPGFAATVFGKIGEANINVDMIVQDAGTNGKTNIGFTVEREDFDRCVALLEEIAPNSGIGPVSSLRDIAKLSVAGIGLRSHTDIADRLFNSLADAGVNVALINTSEVRINVIVRLNEAEMARNALEQEFDDVLVGVQE